VDKLCWYTGRTDTTWKSYISNKINCIRKVSIASAAAQSSLIHCQARDANTRKAECLRIVLSVICQFSSVHVRSRGFPQMGGYYLLKSNGGDSGNRIFVLYWRCPLIRVSVIRGSTLVVCFLDTVFNNTLFSAFHNNQIHQHKSKFYGQEEIRWISKLQENYIKIKLHFWLWNFLPSTHTTLMHSSCNSAVL
jgi:hypothetical protein